MGNYWRDDELQIIKDHYKDYNDEQLTELIPRHSKTSIATQRKRMGLTKNYNTGQKKYNYSDYEELMKQRGYKIISNKEEFSNAGSIMKYICPKHQENGIQETTLGRLLEGKGCMYCGRERTIKARINPITQEMIDKAKRISIERNWDFQELVRDFDNTGHSKIYVCFICNNHRKYGIQKIPLSNMKRNQKCKYCQHKFLLKEDMLTMAYNGSPHIKILSDFRRLNDYVDCVCRKHNNYHRIKVLEIVNGRGCYYCGLEKQIKKQMLTEEEIDKRIKELNPNAIRISDYVGIQNPMNYKCNKCGWEWEGLIEVSRHCPNCEKLYSFGEHIILNYLNKNKIIFEPQKRFDDCKNQRSLPFDFYLPDYNICIEYQGQQHYKPLDYFGGEKTFTVRKTNDDIKRQYCNDRKIKLLEIPYIYNTQDKIEKYLKEHINK